MGLVGFVEFIGKPGMWMHRHALDVQKSFKSSREAPQPKTPKPSISQAPEIPGNSHNPYRRIYTLPGPETLNPTITV